MKSAYALLLSALTIANTAMAGLLASSDMFYVPNGQANFLSKSCGPSWSGQPGCVTYRDPWVIPAIGTGWGAGDTYYPPQWTGIQYCGTTNWLSATDLQRGYITLAGCRFNFVFRGTYDPGCTWNNAPAVYTPAAPTSYCFSFYGATIFPVAVECTTKDAPICGSGGNSCPGMATYSFYTHLIALSLVDTPITYTPSVGQSIAFTLTYNQKEAYQPTNPTISNLGPKWNLNCVSYIEDNPGITNLIRCFIQGGGSEDYPNYNLVTSNYNINMHSGAFVRKTSDSSYERILKDGTRQVYDFVSTNTTPRRLCMTAEIDPSGNQVSYIYARPLTNAMRLSAVVDASGGTNVLAYALPQDVLKITGITDPYGHSSSITYTQTAAGLRLLSITDPVQIVSRFSYASNDFINSLTTPYGTTTFGYSETATNKTLTATDPLNQTECLRFLNQSSLTLPSGTPVGITPDVYQAYANSYYWNKKAWATASNNVNAASVTHWATINGLINDIPLFTKQASENPVWFSYPGQLNGSGDGITIATPSRVARLLDDGTTQANSFAYDAVGNLTNAVDASGRTTRFTYSTNGIDLLQVMQKSGNTNDLIAQFAYNNQHLPVASVVAGVTNTFGYSTNGLLLFATNANGEVMTYNYDVNWFLTNITGHLPGDTLNIAYDSAGRVSAVTDGQGYTVSQAYDGLNRLTNSTFPDSSSIIQFYDKLDVSTVKGRDNRWSYQAHDANRKLTDAQDPAGRIFHYEWCGCGALESITDPKGQMTLWIRDIQNRPIQKLYADLTGDVIAYENTTSRVKATTDAAGKSVSLAYANDNKLTTISYSGGPVTPSINFTYDTNYNRLLKMVDGIGTNLLTYVPAGQVAAGSLQSIDGPLPSDTITFSYDALGRPKSMQVGAAIFSVQYDALGRTWWSSNMLGVTTITYVDATSQPDSIVVPNGLTTVFGYTSVADGSRLQSVVTTNAAGQVVESYGYTYDIRNLITSQTNFAGGVSTVWFYDYDLAQQLTSATKITNGVLSCQYSYSYDKAGNRLTEQVNTSAATEQDNNLNQLLVRTGGGQVQVSGYLNETGNVAIAGAAAKMLSPTDFTGALNVGVGTNTFPVSAVDPSGNAITNWYNLTISANGLATSYSYDKAGNLLIRSNASQVLSFAWDGADRCTAITNGANRTAIQYDGLSRWSRITEYTNGVLAADRRFVWNGLSLAEERDGTGTNVVKRFFSNGFWQQGTNYYYVVDHLGSITAVTTTNGTVVARFAYDPYGKRTQTAGTLWVDYGFAGLFEHQPSGLQVANFRIKDGSRWISRDPIKESGGWNLYAYCAGDPVDLNDPSGLKFDVPQYSDRFEAALSYLAFSPEMRSIIKTMRESEIVYTIDITESTDFVKNQTQAAGKVNLVQWNMLLGSTDKVSGNSISPSLSLGHELIHLYHNTCDSERYKQDTQAYGWIDLLTYPIETLRFMQYDSPEEKRTIELERIIAAELGEGQRFSHHANKFVAGNIFFNHE